MRLRLFAMCVALGGCSNGFWSNCFGVYRAPCCPEPRVQTDISYAGLSPTGAQVSVRVRSDGTATVTWVKDGQDVVQEFTVDGFAFADRATQPGPVCVAKR